MQIFLTGATGFIGSFLVPELISAGHHVVGLSRSEAGTEALTRAQAEVFRGDVNDLDRLRAAAEAAVCLGGPSRFSEVADARGLEANAADE
jgi:uncharacterized protein YbjT (DUF2867 family)